MRQFPLDGGEKPLMQPQVATPRRTARHSKTSGNEARARFMSIRSFAS